MFIHIAKNAGAMVGRTEWPSEPTLVRRADGENTTVWKMLMFSIFISICVFYL
jgi:hypothetical protein